MDVNLIRIFNGNKVLIEGVKLSTKYYTVPTTTTTTTIKVATYGYLMGGANISNTAVATGDRIVFSTQTNSALASANLTSSRMSIGCMSDKVLYGYISVDTTANPDRITFSTDTTATDSNSKKTTNMSSSFGLSDGSSYGYYLGGYTGAVRSALNMRITFSTGVLANNASNLSAARSDAMPLSDGVTYGYALGGNSPTVATADRVTFSTSTFAANVGSNLPSARIGGGTFSNGSVAGYQVGGSANNTTCYKTTYSTSATATMGAILSTARQSTQQGCSTSSVGGYAFGGYVAGALSTTDYMTYSTETFGLVASANPSSARYAAAGLSDFAV